MIAPYGQEVVIDIGTGDGCFICHAARQYPQKFHIGIDANASALAKVSEKIHRKPNKGGLPNALFLQAAVEDLPAELDGSAQEVHVQFPWGSLLRGVVNGEAGVLANLRRVCAPQARLQILLGLDPVRDQTEIARLGLNALSEIYLDQVLLPRYQNAGFAVTKKQVLSSAEWSQVASSWAKRLRGNSERRLLSLTAHALEIAPVT
ncbi:MAG: class I SAM-dependent methyltransferase [Chloroflexi bacterium]|nr:class I SAM-dependent methyltransferase [Chloroflexota bacterium]